VQVQQKERNKFISSTIRGLIVICLFAYEVIMVKTLQAVNCDWEGDQLTLVVDRTQVHNSAGSIYSARQLIFGVCVYNRDASKVDTFRCFWSAWLCWPLALSFL